MGLSSSQARLLHLTTRMHQIEYKAAKLEAEKLQMANESNKVYEDYLDALDKTKIQRKKLTTDGAVTYVDISNYTDFITAGYALVHNGITYDNTTGKQISDLKTALGITSSTVDDSTLLTNIIQSGEVTIVAIDNGTFHQPSDPEFHLFETSVATNTNLQEVGDESLLRKAEAKYEADMRKIDRKERKFDQDLATLDNERNAIKQEMDTLKTVAKENVERTFKIFS